MGRLQSQRQVRRREEPTGAGESTTGTPGTPADRVCCPACRQAPLMAGGDWFACKACGRSYPCSDRIPDLFVDVTSSELSSQVEQANVDHYDRNVSRFIRNVLRPDDYYQYESAILRELSERGHARLLDVGTGTGKLMEIGARYYDEVYGIDVSVKMLQEARRVSANVYRASALRMPFLNDSFDTLTAYSTVHHIIDLDLCLEEMYRVLKPGGSLYTDNDANAAFVQRFGWWLTARRTLKGRLFEGDESVEELSDYHHKTGLDAEQLRQRLLKVGFREVEVRFHFPQNPDEFTQLVMALDKYEPSDSLYYYIAIVARK